MGSDSRFDDIRSHFWKFLGERSLPELYMLWTLYLS